MSAEALVKRIRRDLEAAFGDRLKGVVLYGSEARGEAGSDSDVDVLVLLEGPLSLWDDTRTTALLLQGVQSEMGRALHAMPVDADAYLAGGYALFREASREGIRA
jgi:predicted nucleotidyltransferase